MPPQNSLFALRAALYETDKLLREGIPEAGFEATRTFLVNYSTLWTQDVSRRLGYAIDAVVTGKDLIAELQARLPKMTKADVDKAMKKHLSLQGLSIAIVAGTGTGQAMADKLTGNVPTPITYDTAGTPPEILARGQDDRDLPGRDPEGRRQDRPRRADVRVGLRRGTPRARRSPRPGRAPRRRPAR